MKPNFTLATDGPTMKLVIVEVIVPVNNIADFESHLAEAIDLLNYEGYAEVTTSSLLLDGKSEATKILEQRKVKE